MITTNPIFIKTELLFITRLSGNAFYRKGKSVELLVSYEPRFTMMAEWFKQLFGESEGKDNKGLFPASVTFSTDLHSMGQSYRTAAA